MDDYYAGAEGARRLLRELDNFLQHLVDNVEPAEALSCALKLRVKSGELVSLKKIYRPVHVDTGETEAP
ncbi:MAG TPA: hypothetical protein VFL27_07920 [Candidatus Dormibacteraeota bacterium]|nr:hypothetical protein [Candidatus Dormibacteraeota bacterium]